MADDTTETPSPAPTPAKPAARRRAAPRKAGAPKTAPKSTAGQSAETNAAAAKRSASKPAASTATAAAKPARAKPGPKPGTKRTTAPKPRSSSRPASTATRRKPAASSTVETVKDKVGGTWGLAATVAGGLAAVGAVGAALFSLRGSTPKPAGKKAHTADGSDASKSFSAGIADENTIPDKS